MAYVAQMKELIERLNSRKKMLKDREATQNEYDKNEDAILFIKTDNELSNAHAQVMKEEDMLNKDLALFKTHISEISDRFMDTLDKAKEKNKKDSYKKDDTTKDMKSYLDGIKLSDVEGNFGIKYDMYWNLKYYAFPNQENAKYKKENA